MTSVKHHVTLSLFVTFHLICLSNMAAIFKQSAEDPQKTNVAAISKHYSSDPHHDDKFNVSRHMSQFNFTLSSSDLCGTDLFLVVIVCSAVTHFRQRQAIRDTWGVNTDHVQLLYLLGHADPDTDAREDTQKAVLREYQRYHDLIQVQIVDDYSNLTLKSVAMLQWVRSRCEGVQYVLKTDDDMYLNLPLLVRDLQRTVHTRFIMGHMIAGAQPIRDPLSKWYTPQRVYPGRTYPNYMSGTAYVISGDLVGALTRATQRVTPFWLEDVYVTGLLMTQLDASHIYHGKFGFRPRMRDPCLLRLVITAHQMTSRDLYALWGALQRGEEDCSGTSIAMGDQV